MAQHPRIPSPERALPGRSTPMPVAEAHAVLGRSLRPPFPEGIQTILLGLGCFWGAERRFWQVPGVWVTAVGYAGGHTPNPTYEEVCSGRTGHAEVVLVAWDPQRVDLEALLRIFWEAHDPTQGMRQGNDIGTQYRSIILASDDEQLARAQASRGRYQEALNRAGLGRITTTIEKAGPLYYAEDRHQQYLAKNPHGYCGLAGTGVSCPSPGR